MLIEVRKGFALDPFDLYSMVINDDTGEIDKFQLLLYFSSQRDKCMSLDFDTYDEVYSLFSDILAIASLPLKQIERDTNEKGI